jgi:hypothetical protein
LLPPGERRRLHRRLAERLAARPGPDPARRLERLGRYRWEAGDPRAAVEVTEEAMALLDAGPPSGLQARVLAALATRRMLLGESAAALPLARRAVAVARQADADAEQAHGLSTLGTIQVHLGELDEGLAALLGTCNCSSSNWRWAAARTRACTAQRIRYGSSARMLRDARREQLATPGERRLLHARPLWPSATLTLASARSAWWRQSAYGHLRLMSRMVTPARKWRARSAWRQVAVDRHAV